MINKANRRPVIDPLLLVLKSRRVIIALAALLVSLIVLAVPSLEWVHGELLTLIITLALALIGGYSIEDAAHAARQQPAPPADDVRVLVKDVLDAVVDEAIKVNTPPES